MTDQPCTHHQHEHNHIGMYNSCFSIVPIFNHLDDSEMKEITKTVHPISYPRGQMIYQSGESSKGLYVVHKGIVKVFRISNNGKEQVVRILGPGDFTGELSLFSTSIHDSYAETIEPVQICMIGREDFQKNLLKYPNIALKMLTEFSNRLAKTETQVANIAMETTEIRIAMYLASKIKEQNNNTITLLMSRKDLASYLGTTPETISRKLTEFQEAGWIRQKTNREIEIIDLDALLLE